MNPQRGAALFAVAALAVAASLLAGAPAPARAATGLSAAYQSARQVDPQFRAARYELEAAMQAVPMARAGLLPLLQGTGNYSKITGDRELPTPTGNTVSQNLDYISWAATLQARQPLFNRDAWMRYKQAEQQVAYANAVFAGRENELAVRVSQAYFEVLFAQDLLDITVATKLSYEELVRLARARFGGGEGTRGEVADAQARVALAVAEEIDAKDRLTVSRQALADIAGNVGDIAPLRADWTPTPLQPSALELWNEIARDRSPEIAAQRQNVAVAEYDIQRARSGHYPRLDLIASASESKSETVNVLNQQIRQNTLGVQLAVPIFQGGYFNAATDQAIANKSKEESTLDATTNKVLLDVKRQYLAATNAWSKMAAYEAAVAASEVSLKGAQSGFKAGVRVQADVLDAERILYLSRRDLARSRYDYLVARVKLMSAAGTLTEKDIQDIDRFLVLAR